MGRWSRRDFLKSGAAAATTSVLAQGAHVTVLDASRKGPLPPRYAPNDQIHLALIGAGNQGQYDTSAAVQIPGVKLVAAADCYDGRLAHCREVWGRQIMTTRDYHEILARPDVDAVLVATPDHWHRQAAIDSMNAGKDVYLEKPMIHLYSDGPEIIETARRTKRILQVGSQRVSNIVYKKAKQLFESGALGTLSAISAHWDHDPHYPVECLDGSIPPDASPKTIDWPRFLGSAPKIPFNAQHFFNWRKWYAYSEGLAGDLFVHLFSGTHLITGAHGPTRAMAMAGIRYFKDSREVPDVLMGLFDYPEGFNLYMRVNIVSGSHDSDEITLEGSEGVLVVRGDRVSLSRAPRPSAPDYNIDSWADATQKEFLQKFLDEHPLNRWSESPSLGEETYVAPPDYNDSYDHLRTFFDAVRSRGTVVEDPVFAYRAAGAALLTNLSYEQRQAVSWDPEEMKLL